MLGINRFKNKLLVLAKEYADTRRSQAWLAAIAFSEASFFLIPPDVLLVAILMYVPTRWIQYASISTIFSVAGGLFGYIIGFFLFDAFGELIISTYNLVDEFEHVQMLYQNNAFISVFISAFTPIPYKVFTISAGLFRVNVLVFLIASVLGRGLRFFIVGYVMKTFGKQAHDIVMKYFNVLTLIVFLSFFLIFLI